MTTLEYIIQLAPRGNVIPGIPELERSNHTRIIFNKKKEGKKMLRTVEFFRSQTLKQPGIEHLPTMDDADENKLPALNKLLCQMHRLHSELTQAGIHPQKDKYGNENSYQLLDIEYEAWPAFKISIESKWLDPKYPIALHGGFDFHLYLLQDGYEGRSEIADWINVMIKHVNTTPFSLCSWREHVRTLHAFLKNPSDSYFSDIPMEHTNYVSFDRLQDGLSFKTGLFNQAADDACVVMEKLISRKQFLKVVTTET